MVITHNNESHLSGLHLTVASVGAATQWNRFAINWVCHSLSERGIPALSPKKKQTRTTIPQSVPEAADDRFHSLSDTSQSIAIGSYWDYQALIYEITVNDLLYCRKRIVLYCALINLHISSNILHKEYTLRRVWIVFVLFFFFPRVKLPSDCHQISLVFHSASKECKSQTFVLFLCSFLAAIAVGTVLSLWKIIFIEKNK